MTWEQVGQDWGQRRFAAKEQWAELTEGDLDFIGGHRGRLLALLQRRYGISLEQAQRYLDWWLRSLDRSLQPARHSLSMPDRSNDSPPRKKTAS